MSFRRSGRTSIIRKSGGYCFPQGILTTFPLP